MLSRRPLAGAAKQSNFAQRPPVPLLQPTQPPRPVHFLAPVLRFPVIGRRSADPDPSAEFLHWNSGLCLLQHPDNPLFTKPALFHRCFPSRGLIRGQATFSLDYFSGAWSEDRSSVRERKRANYLIHINKSPENV